MYLRKRNPVDRGRLSKRSLTQSSGNNDDNDDEGSTDPSSTLVVPVNAGSTPTVFGPGTEDGDGNTVVGNVGADKLGGVDSNEIDNDNDSNGGVDTTTLTSHSSTVIRFVTSIPELGPITLTTQPSTSTSAPHVLITPTSSPVFGEIAPTVPTSSALGTSSALAGALLSSSSIVTTASLFVSDAVTISQTPSGMSTSSTVVTTTVSTSTAISSLPTSVSTVTLTSTYSSSQPTPTSTGSDRSANVAGSASGASKSSGVPIAAIIVVVVIVVLAITCLVVYYYRKRTANKRLLHHATWTAALYPDPEKEKPINTDYAFSNLERGGSTRNGFGAESGSGLAPSPAPVPYRAVSPAPAAYRAISPAPYGTVSPQYQYQYSQQQTPIAPPQMAYNNHLTPRMSNQYTPPALAPSRKDAVVEYSFIPTLPDELSILAGETIRVLGEYDDGWALCANGRGEQGMVPIECLMWGSGEWQGEGQGQSRSQVDWRNAKRASSLHPVGAARY